MNTRDLDPVFNLLEATTGPAGRITRQQIVHFLEQPTYEQWDSIHAFTLVREPCLSLAAAVRAVDPNFLPPQRMRDGAGRLRWGWRTLPSGESVVDALKYAAYRWH